MRWTELLLGAMSGVVTLLAYLLLRRDAKRGTWQPDPVEPPKTTSAQDDAKHDMETIDAVISASDANPSADPAIVSDLVGLADRERER